MSFQEYLHFNQVNNKFHYIKNYFAFHILDIYIDLYKMAPVEANYKEREIIFKENYYIFRCLRNIVIHEARNININEDNIDLKKITI